MTLRRAHPIFLAIVPFLLIFTLIASLEVHADQAKIIAEVNQSAEALDLAFEKQDVRTIKSLMTSDHIAVTRYYGRPFNVEEQIASLRELKFSQEIIGQPQLSFFSNDMVLRTFRAKEKGSFKGKEIPEDVFVSQLMVKQKGEWRERFYQVTAFDRVKPKAR
ncbi:MAG: hypothetical protein ACKOW3_08650 [Hyphomicrobium sp.]